MYLSRVQIKNFRNFRALDVKLNPSAVLVGENRVGKSNFIFALRLVLDSSLPDSVRKLKLTDIWDGHDESVEPCIEIHLDFSDFDSDPKLLALLTDYRLAKDHKIARLSYVFRKKAEVSGFPESEADFEFKVYGAEDEVRYINPATRRRICFAILHALRDAETELNSWRTSPLSPLLDDAISKVTKEERESISQEVASATEKITQLDSIQGLESSLKAKLANLAGSSQDIHGKLGVLPTDSFRLFRSIRLLIDSGKRSLSDASLGSANLTFLTLKLAEFEWLRLKNDHNFTVMAIEEPEAHLHPHLQRTVFKKIFEEIKGQPLSLFLTTHSSNLASVSPISSIVLLKQESDLSTQAYSLANLSLTAHEIEDLQRYLDASRAEILFSRAVIFVEGDAEETLIPIFAKSVGFDLDELSISVCNVGGTNFTPYVRLACALNLPFCVITDWDPGDSGSEPLGIKRLSNLIECINLTRGDSVFTATERDSLESDEALLKSTASKIGIFTNSFTLETEIASTDKLGKLLLDVLESGNFGAKRQKRITSWKSGGNPIDYEQLLSMISDIGKGRLAARLAEKIVNAQPPTYIKEALEFIKKYGR